MQPLHFNFLCPVWGESYINRFFSIVSPTFLAPGNLPALARDEPPTFTFLTALSNGRTIREHPGYRRLRRVADVKFIYIDEVLAFVARHRSAHPVHTLNLAYMKGFRAETRDHNSVCFVILNGDKLFSNGSFASLRSMAHAGLQVVYHGNFRAKEDVVIPLLLDRVRDGILDISSRDLLSLGLKNLLPISEAYYWDNPTASAQIVNQLYWKVENEGVIARFYLPHPLMVRPDRRIVEWNGFIDYALVPNACADSSKIAYIEDSDRLLSLEYAPEHYEYNYIVPAPYDVRTCARHLARWTNIQHRRCSGRSMRFIVSDPTPEKWAAVEQRVDRTITDINRLLDRSRPKPIDGHPYWRNNLKHFRRYWKRFGQRGWRERIMDRVNRLIALRDWHNHVTSLETISADLMSIMKEVTANVSTDPKLSASTLTHRLASEAITVYALGELNAQRRFKAVLLAVGLGAGAIFLIALMVVLLLILILARMGSS